MGVTVLPDFGFISSRCCITSGLFLIKEVAEDAQVTGQGEGVRWGGEGTLQGAQLASKGPHVAFRARNPLHPKAAHPRLVYAGKTQRNGSGPQKIEIKVAGCSHFCGFFFLPIFNQMLLQLFM